MLQNKVSFQTSEAVTVIRRERKGLHQVGVSTIFRSRTKAWGGPGSLGGVGGRSSACPVFILLEQDQNARSDALVLCLAVQGTLKSLLQHHSSKASILRRSTFFVVQLSHPYKIVP